MKRIAAMSGGIVGTVILAITIAYAWGSTGHRLINLKAVLHLPVALNALKVDSIFYQTHSTDADTRRNYSDTSFYSEWPRHIMYINGYPNFQTLTHNLDSMIQLFGWERVKQGGVIPWATQWVVDSLTAQFARGDMNTAKQTMSDLGHYVADAHQPLHTTTNFDGQFTGNNGIQSRYGTSMLILYASTLTVLPESVHYVASPIDFAFSYIYESNRYVDSILLADTYAKLTSGWSGSGSPPPSYYAALWSKCQGFTQKLVQQATVDLASLWYTAWVNAQPVTFVDENGNESPHAYYLNQNFPNPFNPTTTVSFVLGRSSSVTLRIYNIVGDEVARLAENKRFPQGLSKVEWNASSLPSGMYFSRLETTGKTLTRKMLLIK